MLNWPTFSKNKREKKNKTKKEKNLGDCDGDLTPYNKPPAEQG